MHPLNAFNLGKAAIGACNHVLTPDGSRELDNPVGHKTRMLDGRRVMRDDARDQDFVLR